MKTKYYVRNTQNVMFLTDEEAKQLIINGLDLTTEKQKKPRYEPRRSFVRQECPHSNWYFRDYCGADVCSRCGQHAHVNHDTGKPYQMLARCFCGWNLKSGERLEDDIPC